jgi:60 kDa SS-A/Ro ribonucleoprotein
MQSPVTGNRGSVTTKTSCVQVAALVAACIARKNSNTRVLLFDTDVYPMNFNERDSIVSNARLFNRSGGGTDCSSALRFVNQNNLKAGLVIYVSDNESWADTGYFRGTGVTEEWNKFKGKNTNAKLVLIDLIPNTTTQANDKKDVLNVGGFSDSVFTVIQNFLSDKDTFVDTINNVKLS